MEPISFAPAGIDRCIARKRAPAVPNQNDVPDITNASKVRYGVVLAVVSIERTTPPVEHVLRTSMGITIIQTDSIAAGGRFSDITWLGEAKPLARQETFIVIGDGIS